ncbi:ABC transporter ATP-binding protein [Corynebacterium incognita]|uniref:ABC transporter ATP-binding protein n=1 Tax=Corynebacterium incognita TaxID=2754725 RepID=A0A7G7CNM3_9CORY|nr:ABC transporter ATP-binding protein [Corynebacterium incognita]QNE89189.1 ABC transporter ATP-binding protein [Corynebacterium incognita]
MNNYAPLPVELHDVTAVFGEGARRVVALDEVSLQLHPGELVAVMGPSGSGKSTLLNVAGLLHRPTAGRVLIDGVDTADISETRKAELRRRHIGFVFQHSDLLDSLTIGENVAMPLELDGMPRRRCQEAAEAALERVGLHGVMDRFPEEVSGGQAQRAAIARALVGPRSILLADEPTGALDTTTGDAVMRVLRESIDDGATGLLVTHEPRFAAYADRVLMVRDGKLTGEEGSRHA